MDEEALLKDELLDSLKTSYVDLSVGSTINLEQDSVDDDYIKLTVNNDGNYYQDEASNTLALCKKYVVKPYNVLLKVIGWRSLQNPRDRCPGLIRLINTLYPVVIFVMLIIACIAQVVTCFSRSKSTPPNQVSEKYYVLQCNTHVFTFDILPYLMKLTGYLFALYTFRIEPEKLSALASKAFLSFNDVIVSRSRRKPLLILLAIILHGVCYFMMSAVFSIIRLIGFKLYTVDTVIAWFSNNATAQDQSDVLKLSLNSYSAVHYTLVVIAYLGFLFFDLLYIAVTINYCSQCQLLTYYIENIQEKVRNKKYKSLNLAIKEISGVHDFLAIVNGNIAIVATLILYTFLANIIISYVDLTQPDKDSFSIVIGFLNTFQWIYISILPILMAARLTSSGNELRRLGQEIAARPFYYSNTSDMELQSFLIFTQSTRYQVNLAFVPMQPSLVYGCLFIAVLLISSGVVIPQIHSVLWF